MHSWGIHKLYSVCTSIRVENKKEGEFSWIKTGFGHCPIEQANVFAFLLLWVDWDSATFPGHLLPTPTLQSSSNRSFFTPKTSSCCAVIGCPGQGPEREGWALRIFRNIFFSVLAFANICFQSTLVKRLLLFLSAVWVIHTHTPDNLFHRALLL